MGAVQFDVAYRLDEYRTFVLEHIGRTTRREPGVIARFFICALAAAVFVLKSRKIGRCGFTVDEDGIRRRSRGGELNIRWFDVTAVHRYSPGLLIEKARGAVPIPYRCLTTEQLSSLDAFVALWERSRTFEGKGDV